MYRFAFASIALMFGGQLAYAQCSPAGGVVVNEIYPNAEGSDSEKEWVEIVNNTQGDVDISGWTLWAGTSSYNTSFEVPPGTFMVPGQHLHLGGPLAIPTADIIYPYPGLVMGNAASNCDAIQLRDCNGAVSDTLVYGATNSDQWMDDLGQIAVCAPPPNSEQALGRVTSGMDTDDLLADFDWYPVGDESPGGANWFKIWADNPLTAGAPANIYVRGALPGNTVYFGASLAGMGAGPCYAQLDGTCVDILNPLTLVGNAVSDAARMATFNANVPAQLGGSDVWLQAGVPGQGPYKSNVWMNTIQ